MANDQWLWRGGAGRLAGSGCWHSGGAILTASELPSERESFAVSAAAG